MFIYDQKKRLVAFESGPVSSTQFVVFIGGLTDGFLGLPYLELLNKKLNENNWSLIQLLLSSSYTGYGISSLQQDSEEIDQFLAYFQSNRTIQSLVLCGHSTGSQDILYYLKNPNTIYKQLVKKIILQGAVSDRDYMSTLPNYEHYLQVASEKVSTGKGLELMEVDAYNIPITAYRYHSFAGRLADDDMFSNDLTDDELRTLYSHKPIPTLIVNSTADQYVPPFVDMKTLIQRMANILNAKFYLINGARHNLIGYENIFVNYVINFVADTSY